MTALMGLTLALGLMAAPLQGRAQVSATGEKTEGENLNDQLPTVLSKVQVTQHLNAQLPLDAPFVDDEGKPVTLAKYFDGKHPVVLTTVYYNCPMLCSEEMDGLTSALEMVHLVPGKDFQIVIISIDPTETPKLAAEKKAFYLRRYGHTETAAGWHYLTGQEPAIFAVTKTVGFGYVRVPGPDGRLTQYAHASSIEIATPQGKLAQYYLGVEYSPKDVLLGLVDASGNRIGSPVANILVVRVVQLGGIVTVASLGGFIFLMFRRDIQLAREQDIPQPGKKKSGEMDKG
jgi:protein SCO1/2